LAQHGQLYAARGRLGSRFGDSSDQERPGWRSVPILHAAIFPSDATSAAQDERSIAVERRAEPCSSLLSFLFRELQIHRGQHREHCDGQQRWPLNQEPGHNQNEADILRVAHIVVRACGRKRARPLRLVENPPGSGDQNGAESSAGLILRSINLLPHAGIGIDLDQDLAMAAGTTIRNAT
jgi:hypothetical protein